MTGEVELVEAAQPTPDPRIVALQALVDAENRRDMAALTLAAARNHARTTEADLVDARAAYVDAMAETDLR